MCRWFRWNICLLIVNEKDELVGVGIAMPSMSRALQKAHGKMFPFGFVHLLKALKGKNDIVDLLLVAIHPDYQNMGANALLFDDILPYFIKNGVKYTETNPEMVTNNKVQQQWQYFEQQVGISAVALMQKIFRIFSVCRHLFRYSILSVRLLLLSAGYAWRRPNGSIGSVRMSWVLLPLSAVGRYAIFCSMLLRHG